MNEDYFRRLEEIGATLNASPATLNFAMHILQIARANKSKSFEWANSLLQFLKEDKDSLYCQVEALFLGELLCYKSVESMLIFVDRPLCSFIRCNLSCSGSDRAELQIGHLKFSKIMFTNPEYRIVFVLIIDLNFFC